MGWSSFTDGEGGKVPLVKQDKEVFKGWDYTSEAAFQEEVSTGCTWWLNMVLGHCIRWDTCVFAT